MCPMASMKDPLVREVDALVEEYSAPEVVEALVTIAAHYRKKFQREMPGEAQGWQVVEAVLKDALVKLDG